MDKRTIIFGIALALSLFGINYYFQSQHLEKRKVWEEQQQGKREKKILQLQQVVKERTASANSLPLTPIYSDENKSSFLAGAVVIDNSLLTISWSEKLPETIFAQAGSDTKPTSYKLVISSQKPGTMALYQKGTPGSLSIGDLPEFGNYELQLVSFDGKAPKVTLGQYHDGHFSIPSIEIQNLLKLNNAEIIPSQQPNSIALLKTSTGYLPVGLYNSDQNTILEFDEIDGWIHQVKKPEEKIAITSSQQSEQKFYVLENPYQQLVFTNHGGALAEINLPFKTKQDELSSVRPIEFDKMMQNDHPYNDHFPAHAYETPADKTGGSFVKHEEGQLGGFYPLLRRDLIQRGNKKSIRVPPEFYALNIISQYPEVAELVYEVKQFDKNSITFSSKQSHRTITKTYSISQEEKGAPYVIDLTIIVEGDAKGLWLTSGVPEVELVSGSPAPVLKYRLTRQNKSEVNVIDLPKDAATVTSTSPDWVVNSNGFFGMITDPLTDVDPGYQVRAVSGLVVPSRLIELGEDQYKPANLPGYETLIPLNSAGGVMKFRFFAGPFSDEVLKTVDKTYEDPATGYNPDYIASQTFHGWFTFISEPFAKFLDIIMKFFHSITGSWGLSIILLTVALRIMLYPLNAWSMKSMIKMQQIAPEVTAIQEKYKKDPKKAQLEVMQLYRDKGVNPVSGCLPMLIQMPFLIGMFDLLKSSPALRGASFIPGWIDNLTAPDVLFSWKTPIFFIGNQFHLLPILLGIVMFIQQRYMSTAPKDANLMTDQQRQQRSMGNIMAVVFAVMFYNFPSGLNLYWLSSMLLGILQQWYTNKTMQKQVAVVQTTGTKKK